MIYPNIPSPSSVWCICGFKNKVINFISNYVFTCQQFPFTIDTNKKYKFDIKIFFGIKYKTKFREDCFYHLFSFKNSKFHDKSLENQLWTKFAGGWECFWQFCWGRGVFGHENCMKGYYTCIHTQKTLGLGFRYETQDSIPK